MEDLCSPVSFAAFYQNEGIEELSQYVLYTTELETTVLSAKEELSRREFEILHLKDLLHKAIQEKQEAQEQCHKLVLEKLAIQETQLLQKQKLKQELQESFMTCSRSEESNYYHHFDSADSSSPVRVTDVIVKLAAERVLPEEGKLLQAVKEAGPLLQTLLLAGPLPQWQHPPPHLDSGDIPPVTISSPAIVRQDSFKSFSTSCFSKKRVLDHCCDDEVLDSSSFSPSKIHKFNSHGLV